MKQDIHRVLRFCLALAALAILGWLMGRRQQTVDHSSDLQQAQQSSSPSARRNSESALDATSPPPGPADSRYAELVHAIAQGDADAAYRFAQGRQACLDLRRAEFLYRYASDSQQTTSVTSAMADARSKLERLRRSCIGNEHVSDDELHDDWARAASMGSRDAQYRYALDPSLNIMKAGTDTERWRQWRDSAPGYLQNLIDEGDPRAVLALAAASDQNDCVMPATTSSDTDICQGSSDIALILPQQERNSYMYYVLDQLLGDTANSAWVVSELKLLERSLTPEEIASAKAEAQQRFSQIHPGS